MEEFEKFLNKYLQAKAVRTVGTGTATDITDAGCTVLRDGQPELRQARFHATETSPKSRHVIIPAEGSPVIYAIVDNQEAEACLLMCSQIEKVITEVGQAKYHLDKQGHLLQVGDQKLSSVIEDLINEVAKIIVVNGRSPNVVALNQIKQRMKKILR